MFEFTPKFLIWLWLICTFIAILGCLYALIAAGLLAAICPKTRQRDNVSNRAVSVLKPLYDTEPELEANLTSFCGQNYGGEVQLIFGLQKEDDPASLVVERLRARFPERDIRLCIDPRPHGANRKISNLINMLPCASHDLDRAVRQRHQGRRELSRKCDLGARGAGGRGSSAASIAACRPAGIWSRLAAEGINSHFLPNALVGLRLGLAKPCFGATIALRTRDFGRNRRL